MMNQKYMGVKMFLHHSIIDIEKNIRGCLPLYCYLTLWNTRNNLCNVCAKDVLEFMGVRYQNNSATAVKNLNALLQWLRHFGYIDYVGEIESLKDNLIVDCKPEYFVLKKSPGGKTPQFISITLDAYYKILNYKIQKEDSKTKKSSFHVILHTYIALKKYMWTKHISGNKSEWKNDPLVACVTFNTLSNDTGKQPVTCSAACQVLKELELIYYSSPIKVRDDTKNRSPVTYSTIFVEIQPEGELHHEWQVEYLYGHYKYVDSLEQRFISQGKNIRSITSCPEEIIQYWQMKRQKVKATIEKRQDLTIEVDDSPDEYNVYLPELFINDMRHEEVPF